MGFLLPMGQRRPVEKDNFNMGFTKSFSSPSTPKLIRLEPRFKYWKEIAEKIEDLDKQLKQTLHIAVNKGDFESIDKLNNLWKRLDKVPPLERPSFNFILKSPRDTCRFAEYVSKESLGFNVATSLAKWVRNPEIKGFRNEKELAKKLEINRNRVGEIYYGRPLEREEEYLKVIREIITDPKAKLAIWEAPGIRRSPRLVYHLEKNGRLLLVLIDEKGFVENCEALEKGWDYFLTKGKEYVDAFYEIDKDGI